MTPGRAGQPWRATLEDALTGERSDSLIWRSCARSCLPRSQPTLCQAGNLAKSG